MWLRRLRYWMESAKRGRQLREEMRLHVEEREEEYRARGILPSDARARARRRFGSSRLAAEDARAVWIWPWLDHLWQDVRYAFRILARNPKFTALTVLTLAIGIGTTTAVFSVVSAVLVRPLPYEDPDELTVLSTNFGPDLPQNAVSGPEFAEMLEFSTLYDEIAAAVSESLAITGTGQPEYLQAAMVSGRFFELLGTQPAYGRVIQESDDVAGNLVAVISDGLWHRQFGGDPAVLGSDILLDQMPTRVIGILPPGFEMHYPDGTIPPDVDVWMPLMPTMKLAFGSDDYTEMPRAFHLLSVLGRVRDGVTLAQARDDMERVAARIEERSPTFYDFEGWGIIVQSLHGDLVEKVRPALTLLLGAVAFVLLIACVNVASLLLARGATREREVALRSALGAGWWRVLRQLLTEGMTTAFLGAGIGLVLAVWLVKVLSIWIPAEVPRSDQIFIDATTMLFTLGVLVLTGILCGLAPALQIRKDPSAALKEGTRRVIGGRIHSLFVLTEVAFAIVLLVGAGLTIRSFSGLLNTDPGYDARDVLTFRVNLPEANYDMNGQAAFFDQLVERLNGLPGVVAAAATSNLPLGGYVMSGTTEVNETKRFDPDAAMVEANQTYVSADYFATLRIPLIEGRYFDESDVASGRRVAIVDEQFARRFWPDEDPIGKEVGFDPVDGDLEWWEIVGVVGSVRSRDLTSLGREEVYYLYDQSRRLQTFGAGMFVALRTESDPTDLAAVALSEVRQLDPDQPVENVATMAARVNTSLASHRFSMLLLSAFAAIALILATVGVYGVVSYSVSQRNREIGIRMALGAAASDVRSMIVRQNLWIVSLGVVLGLMASVALSSVISNLLYDVEPTDPSTYTAVASIVLIMAAVACLVPAIRATRIDPNTVLHEE